jgi:hypothetical protein
MANPQKRKGDSAEREAADLISRLLSVPARRKLGAGRTTAAGGDTGDIDGVPGHVIQVASWSDTAAAARIKPVEAEAQAANAREQFAATFVRFRGGTWRVVLTPEQWAAYVNLIWNQRWTP